MYRESGEGISEGGERKRRNSRGRPERKGDKKEGKQLREKEIRVVLIRNMTKLTIKLRNRETRS